MFEFHGGFAVRDSAGEQDDQAMWGIVARLRERIRRLEWEGNLSTEVRSMNGTYFLFLHGNKNRRGVVGSELDELLLAVGAEAPGSYGVMYWRDGMGGNDDFTVRVMTRGRLVDHPDPFLSPTIPTVEDEWEPEMEEGFLAWKDHPPGLSTKDEADA